MQGHAREKYGLGTVRLRKHGLGSLHNLNWPCYNNKDILFWLWYSNFISVVKHLKIKTNKYNSWTATPDQENKINVALIFFFLVILQGYTRRHTYNQLQVRPDYGKQ